MKFFTFFNFILALIHLISSQLTIHNVQIKFKNRGDQTYFQLKTNFSSETHKWEDFAWVGIGFSANQKMVNTTKQFKDFKLKNFKFI